MENKTKSILIVEDDRQMQFQLKSFLKEKGFKVYSVSYAQDAIDFCIKSIVDLVLLDLTLPDKDGMVVIETLRSFTNTLPIIVISARSGIESKVMAFNTGANDYLTKPFNMLELYVRIQNQFRYLSTEDRHLFINGALTIDYDAKTIYINGIEVHFTNFEYKIIVLLANNIDKTLTHNYIITHIWGPNGQDQNGLRVFMAGIRKKIARYVKNSNLIRTDIGVGYRMNLLK
jgi:two-component system KDP operon response regulator KdpE